MKKAIISAIIIAALAIAYYFVFFLPSQKLAKSQQDKQTFLFNKQTECKNICEKLYQDDKDSLPANSVFNPQYTYNESKNACFYSGGWLSDKVKVLTKRIVDCLTNEEVLTFMTVDNKVFINNCNTCVSSSEEYDMREKEYMGN